MREKFLDVFNGLLLFILFISFMVIVMSVVQGEWSRFFNEIAYFFMVLWVMLLREEVKDLEYDLRKR